VLFFNPGGERYDGYLEYEPWTDWAPWRAGWRLVDETGAAVPHQIVASHEALAGPDRGPNRLVFPVSLPPMGCRLYRFFRDEDAGLPPENPAQPVEDPLWVSEEGLANEHLMVRLDPATGNIASCVLRETGQECVGQAGWNAPQVLDDPSDTWSHGVRRYEDVIGAFGSPRVSVVDRGPLQVSLLLERTYEDNTWLQQLLLRAGEPELIIRNWLHWRGQWRLLKLAFDVATDAPRAVHDTPFAAVERPGDGHEVPTQMWLDVSGPASDGAGRVGLALIDDGKYGCDVTGSTARLTILRSPPYAYHIPHPFGYKPRYDWLDQGLQEFTLVLKPHAGDWRAVGVVRRAREVNLAPVAITAHGHDGSLKPSASLLRLDAPDLEVTALKPAEAGRGAIVRLADRHGDGGAGYLHWAGRRFPVLLGPGEVRTFRLVSRGRRDVRCVPCDLLERPLGR
jgi:alpha-mannosidase